MKWFQFLAVFFLAFVCINADETVQTTSEDELDVDFYGIDDPEGKEAAVDSEEPEVGMTTSTAMLSTRGPWSGRRGQHGRHHGRHHGGHSGRQHWGGRGNSSPETKLNYICNSLQSESNGDRLARMFEHKFARLSAEQRATLQQAMAARKAAMSTCCQMIGEERQQCADNMRNERYERVCNGEEALCIWTELKGDASKTAAMSATVARCCASTGEERNTCFTEARAQYFRGGSRRSRNSWGSQP